MIYVDIYRQHSQIKQFTVTGHAKSGPYGYDLVCAGVSAVTFGSVNAIMELGEMDLPIEQGGEGGFLRVTVPQKVTVDAMKKAQTLLEGMVISLKTIEKEYGENIYIHD
ncbi:ribosomal-processing cysteine protease Prp [Lentibacillus halophilus]|uniref:Ribosomal processing cysteine protease Prp n=1 Tax=Lentibacillus halophilus TaxID=295065 RepID=A0ABN0ZBH6_9BACI